MEAKTLQLPSQTIAYYESEGPGHPVLLVHGNSASGKAFRHQLESDLGQKYRLVAIDLPGHGESEMASDPATYSPQGYARVIAEAAEALNMENAVFVGWSLGGHILLEAASDLPEAAGILIFGTPPLANPPQMETSFMPNPAVNIGFIENVTEEQAYQYAQAFLGPRAQAEEVTPFVRDIMRTHGQARVQVGQSVGTGNYKDEVEIVAQMETPLAVLHGADEQLVSGDYLDTLDMPSLWRGEVQIIEDAGHAPQWQQPEAFNRLLAAFVEDVT